MDVSVAHQILLDNWERDINEIIPLLSENPAHLRQNTDNRQAKPLDSDFLAQWVFAGEKFFRNFPTDDANPPPLQDIAFCQQTTASQVKIEDEICFVSDSDELNGFLLAHPVSLCGEANFRGNISN